MCTQSGAVDWIKIALAAVVSLVATANEITVAAYPAAVMITARVGGRRTWRAAMKRNTAATSERPPAICQPDSCEDFIAAPAVDHSRAAARSQSRLDNDHAVAHLYLARQCPRALR